MTIEQVVTDITAVLGAIGVISAALAHLPLPAKYAQFFARLATYAANTKFSVNQRDTLPKPPAGTALAFLLAMGFAFNAQACSSKPPCDQAKLAGIVAACTLRSQQCVNEGKSKAECSSLSECDAEISRACGAGE